MAVGLVPIAQARSFEASLPPGAIRDRVRTTTDAAVAANQPTVNLGWVNGTATEAQLDGFMRTLNRDGFAAAAGPTKLHPLAVGVSPDVSKFIERTQKQAAKVPTNEAEYDGAKALRRQLIADTRTMLQRPDLTDLDKSRLRMGISSFDLDITRMSGLREKKAPGLEGYNEMKAAVQLAPDDPLPTQAFLRGMYAMKSATGGLSFWKKPFLEGSLGIKLDTEAAEAVQRAARFPNDPAIQVGRLLVAKQIGNKPAEAEAKAAVAALRATRPEEVAAAERAYAGSKNEAESTKADKKEVAELMLEMDAPRIFDALNLDPYVGDTPDDLRDRDPSRKPPDAKDA